MTKLGETVTVRQTKYVAVYKGENICEGCAFNFKGPCFDTSNCNNIIWIKYKPLKEKQ